MATMKLVKGDSRTVITTSIVDRVMQIPEDLTSATVILHFREAESITDLFQVVGVLLPGYINGDDEVDTSLFLTPGSGGRVQFQIPVGALNIDAGQYEGSVEIQYPTGGSQTVYDLLKFLVRE